MTTRPCAICHKDVLYGSTCTDVLCDECAKLHDLCKHCGADRELRRNRRKFAWITPEPRKDCPRQGCGPNGSNDAVASEELMRVVHCKREPSTKYIGRGSIYGNPFTHLPVGSTKASVQVGSIDEAVDSFEEWLRGDPKWAHVEPKRRLQILQALSTDGTFKDDDILGCFCRPAHRCHGDVLDKLWQEIHFDITDGRNRYVPCPVCHSVVGMGISTRNGYQFVRCTSCDHEGPMIQCIQPSLRYRQTDVRCLEPAELTQVFVEGIRVPFHAHPCTRRSRVPVHGQLRSSETSSFGAGCHASSGGSMKPIVMLWAAAIAIVGSCLFWRNRRRYRRKAFLWVAMKSAVELLILFPGCSSHAGAPDRVACRLGTPDPSRRPGFAPLSVCSVALCSGYSPASRWRR